MKNFSAKNAEFETVTINNEAAITSADIGTAPNKIPLNKDLGSLAYQDAVNLDDVSADMIELRAIAAEISDTAVDVFVYDTSRDSDGGAWRKRTQHTSWYNEELNTATRGARREFPAVAVIIAEANKVTIYDGDDPDMGMWMVFEVESQKIMGGSALTCLAAKNGSLVVGSVGYVMQIKFIIDEGLDWYVNSLYIFNGNISQRNVALGFKQIASYGLVHQNVNDVAMTVLPNAPIDDATGLPVPTIAVATDGGVSVIKDDGMVFDITGDSTTGTVCGTVDFYAVNRLVVGWDTVGYSNRHTYTYRIPTQDTTASGDFVITDFGDSTTQRAGNSDIPFSNYATSVKYGSRAAGDDVVFFPSRGFTVASQNESNPKNGMVCMIKSQYNTGWMCGDIKLAALSDSVVENVGVDSDNLLTGNSSTFDGGVGDWSSTNLTSHGNTTSPEASFPGTGSNSLRIDVDTGEVGWSSNTVSTVVGQAYMIAFDYAFGDGCTKITVADSTGGVINRDFFPAGGNGATSIHFIAESTQTDIRLATYGGEAFFDNISVRATTELITNGDFSNGDDGSWTDYSAANLTTSEISTEQSYLGNNSWKFVSSLASSGISQSHGVFTEEGKTYTLSGYVYSSTGKLWLRWRNGNDSGYIVDNYELVSGTPDTWLAFSVTAKETSSGSLGGIRLVANAAGTFYVDGLSIRPAEEDRSVNNNGLQIVGEINKAPVAPGADLVSYSGFSANNYLVQPYNEDLNFGTGDLHMMCWHKKQSAGDNEILISKADFSTGQDGAALSLQHSDSKYYAYTTGGDGGPGGDNDYLEASFTTDNTWHHVAMVRKDGVLTIYVDGVVIGSGTRNYNVNNSGDCFIGTGNGIAPATTTSLALIRIGGSAPEPDQIAKIYRDEKPLFQEGSQATLYGTSDAVTALSYDEKTELLHVGTSAGRSDFSGLRRINNTTTAITTSISAHNNLIAEQ